MPFHQPPPLQIRQEGSDVRITTPRLNFLFPASEAQDIHDSYDRLAVQAHKHFAPRWQALPPRSIDQVAFSEIVQELTLHWMYVQSMNHLPLQIDTEEWDHPQTRRIIQAAVERDVQPDPGTETQLCAVLMGLTEAEYLRWREADDAFLGMV